MGTTKPDKNATSGEKNTKTVCAWGQLVGKKLGCEAVVAAAAGACANTGVDKKHTAVGQIRASGVVSSQLCAPNKGACWSRLTSHFSTGCAGLKLRNPRTLTKIRTKKHAQPEHTAVQPRWFEAGTEWRRELVCGPMHPSAKGFLRLFGSQKKKRLSFPFFSVFPTWDLLLLYHTAVTAVQLLIFLRCHHPPGTGIRRLVEKPGSQCFQANRFLFVHSKGRTQQFRRSHSGA